MDLIFSCISVENRPLRVLIVGLDNSGKTTTMLRILNKGNKRTVPAKSGYTHRKMRKHNVPISLYDLNYSKRYMDLWPGFYAACQGLIFVVDSADSHRVEKARRLMESVFSYEHVLSKPILLILNKQDMKDAINKDVLIRRLRLELLVKNYNTSVRVECCEGSNKSDLNLQSGFEWLYTIIKFQHDL